MAEGRLAALAKAARVAGAAGGPRVRAPPRSGGARTRAPARELAAARRARRSDPRGRARGTAQTPGRRAVGASRYRQRHAGEPLAALPAAPSAQGPPRPRVGRRLVGQVRAMRRGGSLPAPQVTVGRSVRPLASRPDRPRAERPLWPPLGAPDTGGVRRTDRPPGSARTTTGGAALRVTARMVPPPVAGSLPTTILAPDRARGV